MVWLNRPLLGHAYIWCWTLKNIQTLPLTYNGPMNFFKWPKRLLNLFFFGRQLLKAGSASQPFFLVYPEHLLLRLETRNSKTFCQQNTRNAMRYLDTIQPQNIMTWKNVPTTWHLYPKVDRLFINPKLWHNDPKMNNATQRPTVLLASPGSVILRPWFHRSLLALLRDFCAVGFCSYFFTVTNFFTCNLSYLFWQCTVKNIV